MRSKRAFVRYNKILKGKSFTKIHFSSKPQSCYQPNGTGNYKLISNGPSVLFESFFNPFFKISKQMLNRSSFLKKSISLNKANTSKPLGIRMGKGKGKIDQRLALIWTDHSFVTFNQSSLVKAQSAFKRLKGRTSSKIGLTLVKDIY